MLYLLRTEEKLIPIYDKLDKAIDILNDIYESTLECFVLLHNNIQMEDVLGIFLLQRCCDRAVFEQAVTQTVIVTSYLIPSI